VKSTSYEASHYLVKLGTALVNSEFYTPLYMRLLLKSTFIDSFFELTEGIQIIQDGITGDRRKWLPLSTDVRDWGTPISW
jgi:hypothetical protein